MYPEPGQVLHFSEDPAIERFVPRIAATARQPEAYVWAVDARNAPSYWFPRQCPRALAWTNGDTNDADRERILGPGGGNRVHAIEYEWLDPLRTVQLFAYRLAAEHFRPLDSPSPHAWVATVPNDPLGPPEPVGNLLALHEQAGIQLRVLTNLWTFWDAVTALIAATRSDRTPLAPAQTPRPTPCAMLKHPRLQHPPTQVAAGATALQYNKIQLSYLAALLTSMENLR